MREFVLIFRMDITSPDKQPSPEQMQSYMQQWMEWIEEISDNDKLSDGGNHLSRQGRVLRPGGQITDGPFIENRQSVAGYILILAENLEEAVEIAAKCPILHGENTSVEVRETGTPGV